MQKNARGGKIPVKILISGLFFDTIILCRATKHSCPCGLSLGIKSYSGGEKHEKDLLRHDNIRYIVHGFCAMRSCSGHNHG
jgi:hypothetical protein